jgi:hypothetical protein
LRWKSLRIILITHLIVELLNWKAWDDKLMFWMLNSCSRCIDEQEIYFCNRKTLPSNRTLRKYWCLIYLMKTTLHSFMLWSLDWSIIFLLVLIQTINSISQEWSKSQPTNVRHHQVSGQRINSEECVACCCSSSS